MRTREALGGRFGLTLVCVLGLAVSGCGKSDKGDKTDQAPKPEPTAKAGDNGIGAVKGSATGSELKAKADWGFAQAMLGKKAGGGGEPASDPKKPAANPQPAKPAAVASAPPSPPAPTADGKIDPSTISRAGIPQPINGFAAVANTGFRVAYARSRNPLHDKFRVAFQQQKAFETVADALNKAIKLPRIVDIHMVNCGQINAFYDPNNSRIIMCYEIMEYFLNLFRPVAKTNNELGVAVVGATFFTFFHELGHALRHTLALPVTGREEDAVDQLSTLTLLTGGDDGINAAMAGARWFALQDAHAKRTGKRMPFWDEHSLSGQRFYNVACLIYGSNPRKFGTMVRNGYLPVRRARRCPSEYKNAKTAWETLLKPHMRQGAAGAPTPAPTPTPTPKPQAPKPPPAAAINCQQVAVKVAQLFMAAAQSRLPPNASQAQREALNQELAANLPMLRQNVINACNKGWTAKQRACIMSSKTWARADRCNQAK